MTKKEYIDTRFDIEELTEAGFFKKGMTYEEMEERVCHFFSLDSIFEYDFIMKEQWNPVKADIKTFSIN